MDFKFTDKLAEEEESEFIPLFLDLKFLYNNGLIGIDMFRCWIEWNILPLSRRDELMYDGTLEHPQCSSRRQLSESEIIGVIKRLTSESLEECAKIGLNGFCRVNLVPPKTDVFWRRGPKTVPPKSTKVPIKKKKKTVSRKKTATKDSSFVGDSHADEANSEGDDNESKNDAVKKAKFTPSRKTRNTWAQAKKRKTGDSPSAQQTSDALGTSTFVPEAKREQKAACDIPAGDIPDARDDSPVILKETAGQSNPPSPLKATDDLDIVVTGFGYSTPPTVMLSKHTSKASRLSPDGDSEHLKLPQYEKLEFDQLCSGFTTHLEKDFELKKSLLRLMRTKHEESMAQSEPAVADLKKNLTGQQDAYSGLEAKFRLLQSELEKMKADQEKFDKKANADQATILKRAEQAEEKLKAAQQELTGLKKHVSNMTVAMFVMGSKEPTMTIKKMLSFLSTLPPQVEELKRSAVRTGVLNSLSRCLAYAPELKTEEIVTGYPKLKVDGTEFTEVDYKRTIVESCYAATQLAASFDLKKYQAAYDENKKKVTPPSYQIASLVPSRPRNPFNLDLDLSDFLAEEDEFIALSKCNWKLGDLRTKGGERSRQGDSAAA
ncbi:hypothetical protein ZWY2020_037074 [Hordeum vulgare]|nr:hypothetical protein ZWY2020_037074 [Hordeum vulgare]